MGLLDIFLGKEYNSINTGRIRAKKPSMNEIIQEIHTSFDTEVDELIKFSKNLNSLDSDKQELLNKRERLVNLGFINSKEVKEADLEIKRLEYLKEDNESKQDLLEAINYYSFKYPNYKFITEDSVKKLCEKYNLVYSTINRYIGDIPNKNLSEIENFKLKDEDETFLIRELVSGFTFRDSIVKTISGKDVNNLKLGEEIFIYYGDGYKKSTRRYNNLGKAPLEIVAPLKDFNLTQAEVKDFKISDIVILDPVVLKPVMYKNKKHYLVVSKWGLEASDELVVNHKLN